MIFVDLGGNPGQFDLLKLLGFQRRVVLQLASTARAIVQIKFPEGVDLIFGEGRPFVARMAWLTALLSFRPLLLGCFLVALRGADDVRRRGLG